MRAYCNSLSVLLLLPTLPGLLWFWFVAWQHPGCPSFLSSNVGCYLLPLLFQRILSHGSRGHNGPINDATDLAAAYSEHISTCAVTTA